MPPADVWHIDGPSRRSVGSKSRQDDRRDHCGGGGDQDVIGSGDDLGGAIAVIYRISEGGFALLAFIF